MKKGRSIALINRHPPYGTICAFEGFRVIQACIGMDVFQQAGLFFLGASINGLTKNHKPKEIFQQAFRKSILRIVDFDIKLFVCQPDLNDFGLTINDFHPKYNIIVLDSHTEVLKRIRHYDICLTI